MINHLDSEFKLSRTNGSRVKEKGCGSTFGLYQALLSQKISSKNRLPTFLNLEFQTSRITMKRLQQKTGNAIFNGNKTSKKAILQYREAVLLPEWHGILQKCCHTLFL